MSAPILIALHDFHRGGTERIALALAKSWVEMGRAVVILCGSPDGGLRENVDPRIQVVTLNPPIARTPLSRLRLGRAMAPHVAAIKPSVIFLPGNFHLFLAGPLHRAAPRAVIVLKISNPPLPGGIARAAAAPVLRFFTRAVDGFAAMNAGLARELRQLLPGRAVQTLYDPAAVTSSPRQGRTGIAQIVWIGRLEPQKDPALALETLRALAQMRPAHLTLIGDGALRADVMRSAAGLAVTYIPHAADVAPLLAAADALLITSRYEGGPAVAVEALAQGVPVVTTDCSHLLHEIIVTPQAGRIIASRDPRILAAALAEVCDVPRADLAALVERFAPQSCARAYLDWFDALAQARHDG